ncbi:alpha amylase C-terminal domain-containing protein [Oligoflexia bacterium]|nr:alpha amylase C-terminal domain-containing protein [Oligoflexia bacterium]
MNSVLDEVKGQISKTSAAEPKHRSADFKIIQRDPYLEPHRGVFIDMDNRLLETEYRLTQGNMSLVDFASAHQFFGMHLQEGQWVFREWAPNATALFLIGDFSNWQKDDRFALHPIGDGRWQIELPAETLKHCDLYRLHIEWPGGMGDRIPAYTRRCVQDPDTKIFSAQVWQPEQEFEWKVSNFTPKQEPLLIYETHVGMALEEEKIGSYLEFKEKILPRIVAAGYNTIQFMAIQEHPYYGSFGYQVANFFAPSSRFGTPEELKELIDAAHAAGISVFLDLVHSHAVKNEVEGLSRLDGTLYQYFHDGGRGEHPVWDSRLFNYGKTEVLHFLLSNIRYWLDNFKFDGFRFDGVTSMLYHDHGLGDPFSSYDRYFGGNLDRDALTYMGLMNKVAHAKPGVITIAEDVSGFPGLATAFEDGGFGFDYRLAMGIPDYWTRTLKKNKDEDWHVEEMFHELTNRRGDERIISYAESHDQALVGDQTIVFRLLETLVYDSMHVEQRSLLIERGLALHCMIRLMTIATAGHGYLNFMGNEFGHPEWIDFPRDGNDWSFHHARRQWSLRDNPELQYHKLAEFDAQMIKLVKNHDLYAKEGAYRMFAHHHDQVLVFGRGNLLFLFNFNPFQSFDSYWVNAPAGEYRLVLNSDDEAFGGTGRLTAGQSYFTLPSEENGYTVDKMQVYLPTRTALVMERAAG